MPVPVRLFLDIAATLLRDITSNVQQRIDAITAKFRIFQSKMLRNFTKIHVTVLFSETSLQYSVFYYRKSLEYSVFVTFH